ncbi:MAG: hypothetical protein V1814_00935 [Candidatus Moraniibacteriota bacterium]
MKKFIVLLLLFIPVFILAQDAPEKKAYYFYGDQCPHCKNVDAYFTENGIYDKYKISKLDFSNPFNGRLLLKFGEAYNDPNKGGVPAIAFGDKFIVGDQPIISSFVQEIDAAENAGELPDPDKIGNKGNAVNKGDQGNSPSINADGNKKNYFPVVIITLIVLGAGALIYVNHKKS